MTTYAYLDLAEPQPGAPVYVLIPMSDGDTICRLRAHVNNIECLRGDGVVYVRGPRALEVAEREVARLAGEALGLREDGFRKFDARVDSSMSRRTLAVTTDAGTTSWRDPADHPTLSRAVEIRDRLREKLKPKPAKSAPPTTYGTMAGVNPREAFHYVSVDLVETVYRVGVDHGTGNSSSVIGHHEGDKFVVDEECVAREGDAKPGEVDKLVHFATAPFKATCGADIPGQATTRVPSHVTCEACAKIVNPLIMIAVDAASAEEGFRRVGEAFRASCLNIQPKELTMPKVHQHSRTNARMNGYKCFVHVDHSRNDIALHIVDDDRRPRRILVLAGVTKVGEDMIPSWTWVDKREGESMPATVRVPGEHRDALKAALAEMVEMDSAALPPLILSTKQPISRSECERICAEVSERLQGRPVVLLPSGINIAHGPHDDRACKRCGGSGAVREGSEDARDLPGTMVSVPCPECSRQSISPEALDISRRAELGHARKHAVRLGALIGATCALALSVVALLTVARVRPQWIIGLVQSQHADGELKTPWSPAVLDEHARESEHAEREAGEGR